MLKQGLTPGRFVAFARIFFVLTTGLVGHVCGQEAQVSNRDNSSFRLDWRDNYLTITSPELPGKALSIHYLEAYCRPDSHATDWVQHTVVGHHTRLDSQSSDGRSLKLICDLTDGVIVKHHIYTRANGVVFDIVAMNPTQQTSESHWAQPCIRVGEFTGLGESETDDKYAYMKRCFIFQDGKRQFMPTKGWARTARYTPGQVWVAPGVAKSDVNPRPVNTTSPDNGLIGCISADEKWLMAVAFHPYQELFQGVIRCIHSDFRIGGLEPSETKQIRGFLYLMPNDTDALLQAYRTDFSVTERSNLTLPR